MSQEIEEMEMMDRQFNNMGGEGGMFTRRSQMDRFSNPWDIGAMEDEEYGFRGQMMGRGRGGMMNTRGRGMMRPNMGGMDMDFRGGGFNDGMIGGMGGGGGGMGRGLGRGFNRGNGNRGGHGLMRGGMNNGRGDNSFTSGGNIKDRIGSKNDDDIVVNPVFDSLYEPEFNSKNSAFEKARAKMNSKAPSNPRGGTFPGGGPGSYRGGRGGGPPRKTWSN